MNKLLTVLMILDEIVMGYGAYQVIVNNRLGHLMTVTVTLIVFLAIVNKLGEDEE